MDRRIGGEKAADDEKGRPLDLSPTLPPGEPLHSKTAPILKILPINFLSFFWLSLSYNSNKYE